MKKILLITSIILLVQNVYCQRTSVELCKAKCLIQDSFSIEIKELPIYDGEAGEDESFIEFEYIEIEGISDSILIVIDTMKCKDFYLDYYEVKRLVKVGGITEVRTVLCESKRTNNFYSELRKALEENGFPIEQNFSSEIETRTRTALVKFQKKNGLPIGQIDFETLIALGLDEYVN